jgi:hypothetical protein
VCTKYDVESQLGSTHPRVQLICQCFEDQVDTVVVTLVGQFFAAKSVYFMTQVSTCLGQTGDLSPQAADSLTI